MDFMVVWIWITDHFEKIEEIFFYFMIIYIFIYTKQIENKNILRGVVDQTCSIRGSVCLHDLKMKCITR